MAKFLAPNFAHFLLTQKQSRKSKVRLKYVYMLHGNTLDILQLYYSYTTDIRISIVQLQYICSIELSIYCIHVTWKKTLQIMEHDFSIWYPTGDTVKRLDSSQTSAGDPYLICRNMSILPMKIYMYIYMWGVLKMGGTSKSSIYRWIFHCKPSSELGDPPFMETPIWPNHDSLP